MEWMKWDILPDKSSRSNPIWIYSRKNQTIKLGYYSAGYGYFDMEGNGISCAMWTELTKPKPPKQ